MSKWRRLALEQMPSLHQIISDADDSMAMWIDLDLALLQAYEEQPREEAVIRDIYGYAHWCFFEAANTELAEAVAFAFYEHLPLTEITRQDLPNRLSAAEFEALGDVFTYHLGVAGLKQLTQEFRDAKQLSAKRKNP